MPLRRRGGGAHLLQKVGSCAILSGSRIWMVWDGPSRPLVGVRCEEMGRAACPAGKKRFRPHLLCPKVRRGLNRTRNLRRNRFAVSAERQGTLRRCTYHRRRVVQARVSGLCCPEPCTLVCTPPGRLCRS